MMRLLLTLFLLLAIQSSVHAADKIRMVCTTRTIASLAETIAGGDAEIHTIAPPKRDVHFVQPSPKDVLKTKKADVFIHGGLDLEIWRGPLLDAAGRPEFLSGEKAIDVSKGIELLEIPVTLSRAEGDVHAFGNPHYWTDPANAKPMARNIAERLGQIFPEKQAVFQKNAEDFIRNLDARIQDWETRLEPFKGTAVVTYHRSWPYFAKRFGLEIVGQIEPKPGIPPTAKHLAGLERVMKEKGVRLILKETYNENRSPRKIAQKTGAQVVNLAQFVGEVDEARDFISMMEYNVSRIEKALKGVKS